MTSYERVSTIQGFHVRNTPCLAIALEAAPPLLDNPDNRSPSAAGLHFFGLAILPPPAPDGHRGLQVQGW
jgi:hypothetical protein